MSRILNRRQFLTALGLGGAAAALPFGRSAWGQDSSIKRLIVVSTGHGTVYDGWKLRPAGLSEDQPWELDLTTLPADQWSRGLQPLQRHAARTIVYDGLSMASAELDIPGYRHEKGWVQAWTGDWAHLTGSDVLATKPSLDQLVARQIGRPDRVPSLELSVNFGRPICHAGLAQQLPLQGDPVKVWDRLFGLSTSTDPLVAARGSVLDYALAEYDAVSRNARSLDKVRLDQHFGLVRQLEQRIEGLRTSGCGAPERPFTIEDYGNNLTAHIDLVTAAFACDLTRVVSLSLGDLPSADFGWGDYLSGDAHNDFAHRIHIDPQAAAAMTDYHRLHTEQIAQLVDALTAVEDPAGGTLMDHTLIVVGGELADGYHSFEKYYAALIGGSWMFNPGRYVRRPYGGTPIPMFTDDGQFSAGAGIPHQHLLVSVAQAMGLETDTIGLAEVETNEGLRVDLRGPLEGLI